MAVLLPLAAGGQTKEHITRVLGTRDGLSNNFIVSLDMDRRGVLWIGTEEGMDSFDGVSFRSYIRNRGEIPGNALNEVFVDRSADRVWVATQREGLGAMDLATGAPEFFFNRPGDETSIVAREITGITQDKAGNVWFSTYTKGVEKYDPATGEFSHYNAGNVAGMPEYTIISLKAGNGGFGLGTLGGYKLRPGSPAINTGMYVPNAGGRDFFGNALEDGHPDFGAFEAVGTGVFADTRSLAEQDRDAADASSVAWGKWSFPLGLPVDATDVVPVRLYQPLEDGVTGTVTWVNPKNGKPVVVDLAKAKDRGAFSLPVKSDRQTLLSSTVKVELRKGKFTESFEIPFAEKPATRR